MGWSISVLDLDVEAGVLSRSGDSGGDAKNRTSVHFGESAAIHLDFSIEPLWGEVEGDVVVGDSVQLAKLGVGNVKQGRVVGRFGNEMSAFTVDGNYDYRHGRQCLVGRVGFSMLWKDMGWVPVA